MSTTDPAPPTAAPASDAVGNDLRAAWRTLGVASLAVLAVFLDTTVLFVAFPDIVASVADVAPSQLSWVLNAYTIVLAALLVPAGKLADRIGHKRTFITGSIVFTVGARPAPSPERSDRRSALRSSNGPTGAGSSW